MPVNPSQLKSLVDQHSSGPSAAAMGMAPPEAGPDDGYDDMDDGDGTEPATGAARGQQLLEEWDGFGQTLKEEASEIHDLAHDVGAELLLKDVPDDAIKAVGKSVDSMPDDLAMGLAKYVSALSDEDMHALSSALAQEIGEDKADEDLMCAYLTQAGKYAGEEVDVDEDFNAPEDDGEEDGADGEGDGDGKDQVEDVGAEME